MSYVYVIDTADRRLFKIGRSVDPEQRRRSLQTGHPSPLIMCASVECADAGFTESTLHRRFAEYRQSGEWFALDETRFDDLIQALPELSQSVPPPLPPKAPSIENVGCEVMVDGISHIDRARLTHLTRQAVQGAGGNKAVAERIGAHPSAISQAVNYEDSRYDGTRERILCEIGGYEIEEVTHWLIKKKEVKK